MSRYGQQEVCPYSGVIVNKVRQQQHALPCLRVNMHARMA